MTDGNVSSHTYSTATKPYNQNGFTRDKGHALADVRHQFDSDSVEILFTARCYASAVLAMALCPSVCPSVRPSVTSRCSTKTAKRRITQTTPHDTPGTLVFRRQRSPRNSTRVTPCGGAKYRWGGSKSATFDKLLAISRKRYKIDA